MRIHSFLFWVLLLVDGVSGDDEVKSVSVMVGDSVTLYIDDTETQGFEELKWKIQGEKKIIAEIDRETNTTLVSGNDEERFRGRLKLDHQTGFLTITNIRTADSRVYELEIIIKSDVKKKKFNVTVSDGVSSVSVMEGDTVTLHTGVTEILTDHLNNTDARWKNIDLNHKTGEITIRNIQKDQSGDFKVEINTSSMILLRILRITVSDEMTTVSRKEGEYVTLRTGLINIQGYDLIMWRFGDNRIAEINKGTSQLSLYDTKDERFKGRLELNERSGSLTISDSETTDSGVYHLNMRSSSHTLQRNISVTVKGVSADETNEVKMTVTKGHPVTLKSNNTEIQSNDEVKWKFGGSIIARMEEAQGIYKTDYNEIFRDRLELDKQTGSLTILNIAAKHAGSYELEIKNKNNINLKTFAVTVQDVESVLKMEGDSFSLNIGVKVQKDDQIQLKFRDQVIPTDHLTDTDGRRNNIYLTHETRELHFENIRGDQDGEYEVKINTSRFILYRTFRVTVAITEHSHGKTAAIVLAVILILILILIVVMIKKGWVKVPCFKNANEQTQKSEAGNPAGEGNELMSNKQSDNSGNI